MNFTGIIRSVIGTIALGIWDWHRSFFRTLDIPIFSQPLHFLSDVAENSLWKLWMIFFQSGQKELIKKCFTAELLAFAVCARLPSNESNYAASWDFLGSIVPLRKRQNASRCSTSEI